MGVHNKAVYPKIKQELAIPPDEPIFIIRAQDLLAHGTLECYTGLALDNNCDIDFLNDLQLVRTEFEEWQANNVGKVKVPD